MKKCTRCGHTLPVDQFGKYLDKTTRTPIHRLNSRCKKCDSKHSTEWGRKNPERMRERRRRYNATHPIRESAWYREACWKKYGLTKAKRDEMVAGQDGRCAICGRVPRGKLVVDHNHKTGKVRAMLCNTCNTALGFFEKHHTTIKRIPGYLLKYDAEIVREDTNCEMLTLWSRVGDEERTPDTVC